MYRKFALVIGNSDYRDPHFPRLEKPKIDARDFGNLLRSPHLGNFYDVKTLINEDSITVKRHIANFFSQRASDDLLILYYSGHGVLDEQSNLFLATKDTEKELLSVTSIESRFIKSEMERSYSRRQVLILDCCHSGAFSNAKGIIGTSVHTEAAFCPTNGYGTVVFTATDSTQFAWEENKLVGQIPNSVFTYHLIQGIKSGEADQDNDGFISFDELADYTTKQVQLSTPHQQPKKYTNDVDGNLIISVNPQPKPALLPQSIQQDLKSERPLLREHAARRLDKLLDHEDQRMRLAAKSALNQLVRDDSKAVSQLAASIIQQRRIAAPPQKVVSTNSGNAPVRQTARVQNGAGPSNHPATAGTPEAAKPGWSIYAMVALIIASLFIPLIGIVAGGIGFLTKATKNQALLLIGLGFMSACYYSIPLFIYG